MSIDDFDVPSLSEYLHLNASQVQRMADRGNLPGRKIAGQWRFSAAEIHHWLEDRIGASDDGALSQMEGMLDRDSGGNVSEAVSLAALLPRAGIAVPLLARTRSSVIKAMVEVAAQTQLLWDPAKMAAAVNARENLHSTAMENGVALLHPRRPLADILAEPFISVGITSQAIPFGGDRGNLTDVFFLICSTEDRGHLRALARLSRLIAFPDFLSDLRSAPDAELVHQLVADYESNITNS